MAVKDALDKIAERHPDVIGAMVASDGRYYHNLEAPYDMISVDEVMEIFSEMFEQTDLMAEEGFDFSELMIDFPGHSFIVRKLDEGDTFAVIAPRLARGQLVKLQVGLALFGKSIKKALTEEATAPEPVAPVEDGPVLPEVVRPAVPSDFEGEDSRHFMSRPRKGFRGAKTLYARPVDAVSEPIAKEDAAVEAEPEAPATNEDGVPLRPDGTPMKKKMYRGQVYYE